MAKRNDLNFNPKKWKLQLVEFPFKLYKLSNVFTNENSVANLKKEIDTLKFFHKMNDIFSFSQTDDLFNLKLKKNTALLSKYLQFLEYFRIFLSNKFKITLNSKVSVSCSKYSSGDYLLCHDDKCEDRCIAFIFYLNGSWKSQYGGSLDIFDHDENGQPSNVIYSFYPESNSLIFFEVGNYTYHQVAEVITDKEPRITINGWYHSEEALKVKPFTYVEPPLPFIETHTKGGLLYLHHFANSEFLKEEYTDLIVENIQRTGVMMLQDFLKPNIFDKISEELDSAALSWQRKGPANRRRYDIANLNKLPPVTKALVTFFHSTCMCSYLESITMYKLFKKNEENFIASVYSEIQFWRPGYYSLLTDNDVNFKNISLDILLFFNVHDEHSGNFDANMDTTPGNIYYYEKNATSVKCEIEPKNNSICLVHKKKNETNFVSYISEKLAMRYNVICISYKM